MLKKLSMKTRWAIGVVSALVLLVVCAGIVYAANYSGRALPGTTVAGMPVAGMTREQVISAVNGRADATTVTLSVDGATTEASLNEAGITVEADETADTAMEGSTSLPAFVRAIFSARDVEPVVTVSEESIKKFAATVNSTLTSEMKDAAVVVAEDGASFTVTPAQNGNGVSTEDVASAVKQAGTTLTSVTQDLSVRQMEPSITTENAQAVAEKASKSPTASTPSPPNAPTRSSGSNSSPRMTAASTTHPSAPSRSPTGSTPWPPRPTSSPRTASTTSTPRATS